MPAQHLAVRAAFTRSFPQPQVFGAFCLLHAQLIPSHLAWPQPFLQPQLTPPRPVPSPAPSPGLVPIPGAAFRSRCPPHPYNHSYFSSNTSHHSQFLRTSCSELLLLLEMRWLYSPSMWVRSELCNQHKPHPCDTKITTERRRAIQLQKNSALYKAAMVISIIKNTCATSAMPPLRTVNSQVLHNWEAATHICKSNISGRKYFLSLNSRIHGRSCAWYPVWRHF